MLVCSAPGGGAAAAMRAGDRAVGLITDGAQEKHARAIGRVDASAGDGAVNALDEELLPLLGERHDRDGGAPRSGCGSTRLEGG